MIDWILLWGALITLGIGIYWLGKWVLMIIVMLLWIFSK